MRKTFVFAAIALILLCVGLLPARPAAHRGELCMACVSTTSVAPGGSVRFSKDG